MDKRLIKLLNKITSPPQETCMLDTYNQAIHTDCSCTIRTNINTANHHFIMEYKFFQYPRGANKGGILNTEICPTISTSSWENNCLLIEMENIEVIQVGNIVDDTNIGFKNPQRGRIYSQEGLAPCLCDGSGGGGREPKVIEDWKTILGSNQLNSFKGSISGLSPCITSACGAGGGMTPLLTDADIEITKSEEFIEQMRGHKEIQYRIRKLTPRECFRLMGVDDADIDKIQASGISNSQQYKLAGNSIVVDNLYHIFRKMFVEPNAEQNQQLTLF